MTSDARRVRRLLIIGLCSGAGLAAAAVALAWALLAPTGLTLV